MILGMDFKTIRSLWIESVSPAHFPQSALSTLSLLTFDPADSEIWNRNQTQDFQGFISLEKKWEWPKQKSAFVGLGGWLDGKMFAKWSWGPEFIPPELI